MRETEAETRRAKDPETLPSNERVAVPIGPLLGTVDMTDLLTGGGPGASANAGRSSAEVDRPPHPESWQLAIPFASWPVIHKHAMIPPSRISWSQRQTCKLIGRPS